MARLPILEYPDPRLRAAAQPVEAFDAALARLAADLVETLHAGAAIGLSAPQVGRPLQVLVMDLSGNRSAPEIHVNPRILSSARPGIVEESCLSVPGVVGNVMRHTQLRVRSQGIDGAVSEQELEGMHAVCLQHEMDHLAGTLFVDRLSWFGRLRFRARAARAGRAAAQGATGGPV